MKTFLCIFFTIIGSFFTINNEMNYECKVLIENNSFLHIKGSSNINTFTCVYNLEALSKTLDLKFKQLESTTYFTDAIIELKSKRFNCNKKRIDNDFYELLQSEKYPSIHFELLQATRYDNRIEAYIAVEIVNIKRLYKIPVKINDDFSFIEGNFDVDITNFGLIPPKKMLGLITVRKKIEVNFGFSVQIIK